MRDVAAAAEVSQSTVFRVLSGVPTAVPIAVAAGVAVVSWRTDAGSTR
jgi:DNA-binding LacI/PurR family transcriptional regulator